MVLACHKRESAGKAKVAVGGVLTLLVWNPRRQPAGNDQ